MSEVDNFLVQAFKDVISVHVEAWGAPEAVKSIVEILGPDDFLQAVAEAMGGKIHQGWNHSEVPYTLGEFDEECTVLSVPRVPR